jgi:hypothetical protein
MDNNHIEGLRGQFCLCDDCTRGYALRTPRPFNERDIEYELAKMKAEVATAPPSVPRPVRCAAPRPAPVVAKGWENEAAGCPVDGD